MLTPAKIKNHHFDASGRNAYKAESVDAFFEEVSESYEQMFRENGEMYKKIGLLAERLEEYKNDEDNIRNALLTAQRMAEKITREAQEKADALLSDAETRAKTENDRIDALTNDALQKATYQAKSIIDDAQKEADKIIYDATHESKEAAISARDTMIKEEAALQMMKVEVTKFKQQILDSYNEQLALIEKLPEIVYAKFEQEEAEAEETEEETAEAEPETDAEEIPAEEAAEPEAEKIEEEEEEEITDEPEEIAEPEEDAIDVEQLQMMIEEAEDTDAEDEEKSYADDEEDDEAFAYAADADSDEYIIPEIDDSEEEVTKLSEEISQGNGSGDIMFSKPKDEQPAGKGFSVNFENITSYSDGAEDDDDDDELDDFDDDDNNGGFSSKLKGFFRK